MHDLEFEPQTPQKKANLFTAVFNYFIILKNKSSKNFIIFDTNLLLLTSLTSFIRTFGI